jgi:hypothetical protein
MEIVEEQEFLKSDRIRCFSCGALRNIEDLGECQRCCARICGSRETNCKAICHCDAAESSRSVEGNG